MVFLALLCMSSAAAQDETLMDTLSALEETRGWCVSWSPEEKAAFAVGLEERIAAQEAAGQPVEPILLQWAAQGFVCPAEDDLPMGEAEQAASRYAQGLMGEQAHLLSLCYRTSASMVEREGVRAWQVAFWPNEDAALLNGTVGWVMLVDAETGEVIRWRERDEFGDLIL